MEDGRVLSSGNLLGGLIELVQLDVLGPALGVL